MGNGPAESVLISFIVFIPLHSGECAEANLPPPRGQGSGQNIHWRRGRMRGDASEAYEFSPHPSPLPEDNI